MPNNKRRFPFFWKTNEVYEENSAPQDPTYEFNTNLETAYIRMLQSSGRMPYTIQEIRTFIRNPMQDKNLAENPNKAVIVLKNDRGTAYGAYLEVYDVLKAAYRELWDESALAKYGKELGSLSAARRKEIKNEIPMVISEHEPTEFGKED